MLINESHLIAYLCVLVNKQEHSPIQHFQESVCVHTIIFRHNSPNKNACTKSAAFCNTCGLVVLGVVLISTWVTQRRVGFLC